MVKTKFNFRAKPQRTQRTENLFQKKEFDVFLSYASLFSMLFFVCFAALRDTDLQRS